VRPFALRERTLAAVALGAAILGIIAQVAVDGALVPALSLGVCALCSTILLKKNGAPRSVPPVSVPTAPPPSVPTAPPPSVPTAPPPSASGLAAYELVERVGSGTMGEVWKAKHKFLGRVAAIKRIKAGVVDAEDVARFKREARATSALRSPHTVDVYDFGEDAGGFYYAMEFLDGMDLQRLVSTNGPMPPARAISILVQACHSLAEAHAQGVVHRDIKPGNMMLCRYGLDFDFVKLVDFGLAKRADSSGKEAMLTRAGVVLGTAAYLAPESLKGSATVDSRADLYALGAVAFWLLTGKLLYPYTNPMEMVKAHLLEAPPLTSSASRFPIPKALDDLIASCLAKNPDSRPKSAGALADELLAIETADSWTRHDARNWWRSS
jgi:serine/threonine-protein kinase